MSRLIQGCSLLLAFPVFAQHSMAPKTETGTEIHFYADVAGGKTTGSIESPSTFNLGSLDLYVHAQPTEQFSMLTEVAFEPTLLDYGLDVERLEVMWSPRSWFQVLIGRYHTPIGFWNTTYHHGKWLVTSIENPLMFKFEDERGPLPVHTIGALVFGQFDLGSSVYVLYHLGTGNGRGPNPDPPQKLSSIKESKAFVGALHLGVGGFRVGGSLYLDRTQAEKLDGLTLKEEIYAGDVTYTASPLELLLEGAIIRHSFPGRTGPETIVNTYAAYAQAGYQVVEHVKPYARAEVQRIGADEPYLKAPDQSRLLAGVRLDLIEPIALKLEVGNVRIAGVDGFTGRFQVAFAY